MIVAFHQIFQDIDHISDAVTKAKVVQEAMKSPSERILDAFGVNECVQWTEFANVLKKVADPSNDRNLTAVIDSLKYCVICTRKQITTQFVVQVMIIVFESLAIQKQ